jgi:hypothetical protein
MALQTIDKLSTTTMTQEQKLTTSNVFLPQTNSNDNNNNQIIFSLSQASSYFINKKINNEGIGGKYQNLTKIDDVLPEFENIDFKKYSQQDLDTDNSDNKEGCYVQQQYPINHDRKAPIANIFYKETVNALGMSDRHYYFVIYRKKLTPKWSKILDLKGYSHKLGVMIPLSILKRIYQNKIQERCEIILVCGNGEIYSSGIVTGLINHYNKNKWHFINSYDQLATAFPLLEMFKRQYHD